MIIGAHVFRQLARRKMRVFNHQAGCDTRYNTPGNFVLNCKDILQFSIITLRPNMMSGFSVNQLCSDANSIVRTPNTSLHRVSDAKLTAEPFYVYVLAAV